MPRDGAAADLEGLGLAAHALGRGGVLQAPCEALASGAVRGLGGVGTTSSWHPRGALLSGCQESQKRELES